MTTNDVEKKLIELEKQYWQAIKDKDVEAAMQLTTTRASSPERRAWGASISKRSLR